MLLEDQNDKPIMSDERKQNIGHLDGVLVRSLFRLPWKCEDGGCEDDGVVDLYVLLIMHRNREFMDTSCLKTQMRLQTKTAATQLH